MNTSIILFILLLTYLSVYFYQKNNVNYFNDINNSSSCLNEIFEETKSQTKVAEIGSISTNKMEDHNYIVLNKSLKNLEFISKFEMYLEVKNYNNFSPEFLQEFEKIKTEAQLTTLKTSNQLNSSINQAA